MYKNTEINKLSQKKDQFRANNIGVIFQQFNILNYLSPFKTYYYLVFLLNLRKMIKNTFITELLL